MSLLDLFSFSDSVSVENLNATVDTLIQNLTQVEALSEELRPDANMTENIRQIKDLIEEARSLVHRVKYFIFICLLSTGFKFKLDIIIIFI